MVKIDNHRDVQMAEIMKDICYIKTGIDQNNLLNSKEHNALFEAVKDMRNENKQEIKLFREESDKKYASKYIEKISLFCLGALLTAILGYFFKIL